MEKHNALGDSLRKHFPVSQRHSLAKDARHAFNRMINPIQSKRKRTVSDSIDDSRPSKKARHSNQDNGEHHSRVPLSNGNSSVLDLEKPDGDDDATVKMGTSSSEASDLDGEGFVKPAPAKKIKQSPFKSPSAPKNAFKSSKNTKGPSPGSTQKKKFMKVKHSGDKNNVKS